LQTECGQSQTTSVRGGPLVASCSHHSEQYALEPSDSHVQGPCAHFLPSAMSAPGSSTRARRAMWRLSGFYSFIATTRCERSGPRWPPPCVRRSHIAPKLTAAAQSRKVFVKAAELRARADPLAQAP